MMPRHHPKTDAEKKGNAGESNSHRADEDLDHF